MVCPSCWLILSMISWQTAWVWIYLNRYPVRSVVNLRTMSFATINPPNKSTNSKFRHIEDSPRRVRVLFNKKFIADTEYAKLVWEHRFYPSYFLPASDIQTTYLEKVKRNDDGDGQVCRLTVGNRSVDNVTWFDKGELSGLIRFQFSEMGM